MARYKDYNYSQGKFIPIFFDKQILPGTFEHTLQYLIDQEINLSIFENARVVADSGYHSEANVKLTMMVGIDAYIAGLGARF